MFFDESTFRLVNSRGIKVKRPSRLNRYKQRLTIATVKHSASVMVWGRFSGKKGRGGLYFLPKNKTMDSDRYKSVLENHLLLLWADPPYYFKMACSVTRTSWL
jgi:hypothetical protein